MNFLKLLTKSGRREVVRGILEEELTLERVAALAATGTSKLLEAGAGKLGEARVKAVTDGCIRGASALQHVSEAVSPDGDGGMAVTPAERVAIQEDIAFAVASLLTQEATDALVDRLCEMVP